jgi:hypothetical protein
MAVDGTAFTHSDMLLSLFERDSAVRYLAAG